MVEGNHIGGRRKELATGMIDVISQASGKDGNLRHAMED